MEGGWRGLAGDVWKRFHEDNLGLYAAAISFYALLSVVPLLLVGIGALGFVIDPAEAQNRVLDFFGQFIPGKNAARIVAERINLEEAVAGIVRSRGPAALIGFGSLLWAASQVFFHLQTAMNVIWRAQTPRHLIHARALSLGVVVAAGGLFLLSLIFTAVLRFVQELRINVPLFPADLAPGAIPLIWEVTGLLVTLVLSVLTFVFLLRFLPAAPVPWRAAIYAGMTVGVTWEAAKQIFAFYLSRFAQFNKIYGALGSLVGLVLWINISALLLLLGAEIAAVWTARHPRRLRQDGVSER